MTTILTITMNPSIDVSAATEKVARVRKLRCTAHIHVRHRSAVAKAGPASS